jgi:hypothetical protein
MDFDKARANNIRLDNDIISSVKLYFYNSLSAFGPKCRAHFLSVFDAAASHNFNSSQQLLPGSHDKIKINPGCKFNQLYNICHSVFSIITALKSRSRSPKNFNLRCKLVAGILPVPEEQLKDYLIDSPCDFHLLSFLDKFLSNELNLHNTKKEIFYRQLGFSNQFPQLSCSEIQKKLNITQSALSNDKLALASDISLTIKKCRAFIPCVKYDILFGLTGSFVKISPEIFRSVQLHESVQHLTISFMAEFLANFYNYEIIRIKKRNSYYLMKPGFADKKMLTHLLNSLGDDIDSFVSQFNNNNLRLFIELFLRNEYPHSH